MHIIVKIRNMAFLECFSSETRVAIIELLNEQPLNIKELAAALGISSAMITKHVQKMEAVGLIVTDFSPGTRGRQKVCRISHDTVTLQLRTYEQADQDRYSVSIPIGQFESCQVKPTCGLASESRLLGIVDDPRYFSDPDRVHAKHLWFGSGYVEYRVPNYLLGSQIASSLSFSFEICSEAPGYNENWPSDIAFSLNAHALGIWTCPGDFGSVRGVYTPDWWALGTQHGLLKTVTIRPEGTFLDGVRLSDITSTDLAIGVGDDILFRIANLDRARHCGGVSLFGKRFGNYDQELEATIFFTP